MPLPRRRGYRSRGGRGAAPEAAGVPLPRRRGYRSRAAVPRGGGSGFAAAAHGAHCLAVRAGPEGSDPPEGRLCVRGTSAPRALSSLLLLPGFGQGLVFLTISGTHRHASPLWARLLYSAATSAICVFVIYVFKSSILPYVVKI